MRFSTVEAPAVSVVMGIPLSNHENIGILMVPLFFKVCCTFHLILTHLTHTSNSLLTPKIQFYYLFHFSRANGV